MYEEYFNFRVKPFELVPNPDFIYMSNTHKKAMAYLDYGVAEKAGFMLLTGEIGSGKTTLLRDLIKKLDTDVNLSKIFNTKVNSEQLISMINDDFGLDIEGKGKVILLKELNDFLIEQYSKGNHSVLIIDEAQNLNAELLEEVRMLSNLETDRTKLLQIILSGQPELRKILARPELRQLRQRISISCHIQPLTKEETVGFVLHRLEVAGNREAVTFQEGTFDIVHEFSKGIPRFINILCDFLILTAYIEETRELTADLINDVIKTIEAEHKYWQDEVEVNPLPHQEGLIANLVGRLDRIEREVNWFSELLATYINRNMGEMAKRNEKWREELGEILSNEKVLDCNFQEGRRALINALRRSR